MLEFYDKKTVTGLLSFVPVTYEDRSNANDWLSAITLVPMAPLIDKRYNIEFAESKTEVASAGSILKSKLF